MDYEIKGHDMQMLVVSLQPGETIIAEAGAMVYMQDGIAYRVSMDDGAGGGLGVVSSLLRASKRVLAKESFFLTHFTNNANTKKEIGLAMPTPGKIMAVNLSDDTLNGTIICQKSSFLCAEYGTKVDITFTKKLSAGFFGGEGFVLEKLTGEGMAFFHACGTIIEKELNSETLTVDAGCIVGFEDGIDYSVKPVGGLKTAMFGGQGLFFATLSGSGRVYLQSLPFSKLVDRIVSSLPDED